MNETTINFYNRKLKETYGTDKYETIIRKLVEKCIDEKLEEINKNERNEYYKKTNFGV